MIKFKGDKYVEFYYNFINSERRFFLIKDYSTYLYHLSIDNNS